MRLGCCGSYEQAKAMKDAGFDFVEVNVQGVLKGQEDDAAWSASAPDPVKLALPIEAANCLVPGGLPIVGPERDMAALTQYMSRVTQRAQKLGIRRLVFGSGGARKRPEGVDEATATAQIEEFAKMAAEEAGQREVVIVVEHLNQGETNTINSLADELALVEQTDHPALAALVDSYHYGLENEDVQAILNLGDRLKHVHVAEPKDRVQPGAHGPFGEHPDAFDFESFFCALRKIGYDEGISFEGKWAKPMEEAGAETVDYLRSVWTAAGRCEV